MFFFATLQAAFQGGYKFSPAKAAVTDLPYVLAHLIVGFPDNAVHALQVGPGRVRLSQFDLPVHSPDLEVEITKNLGQAVVQVPGQPLPFHRCRQFLLLLQHLFQSPFPVRNLPYNQYFSPALALTGQGKTGRLVMPGTARNGAGHFRRDSPGGEADPRQFIPPPEEMFRRQARGLGLGGVKNTPGRGVNVHDAVLAIYNQNSFT